MYLTVTELCEVIVKGKAKKTNYFSRIFFVDREVCNYLLCITRNILSTPLLNM